MTYIVDILPGRGGTAIAVNNFFLQTLAAVATFITELLIRTFGIGTLFSTYAGLVTLTVFLTWYLKRNIAYYESHYNINDYYALL